MLTVGLPVAGVEGTCKMKGCLGAVETVVPGLALPYYHDPVLGMNVVGYTVPLPPIDMLSSQPLIPANVPLFAESLLM